MADETKEGSGTVMNREAIYKAIQAMERENKTLRGQLITAAPEVLEELRSKNKELKSALLRVQKELTRELLALRIPLDAPGISDKLQVFKTEVLAYCADRKLDPPLWKKLESL